MSNNSQGQIARHFWSQTERGKIGPAELYERQRQCLLEQVLPGLPENAQLLDIGCADGDFSLLFARHVGRVVAFDVGERLIEQGRAKAREQGIDNIEFQVADVFEFSSPQRFDVVSLMGVLTTISDDTAAARVVLRALSMLKPGGQLILKDSVLLQGREARTLLNDQYEAKYRPEPQYTALIRSLGLREQARYPLLTMPNCGQTSVLYVFGTVLSQPASLPIADLRVACYGSMPFHFRSLRPLAACFQNSLLSLSIDEVMAWKPQVIVVADGWSVEFWREYCDAHQVLLIGMRHGSVTRYGYAEPQYNHADYMCGSVWDIEDTLLSDVHPRHGFLLTGNAWVDQVFRLPARQCLNDEPTILFAPTYNPEISAAVFFGDRVVPLIRSVYPRAKIIIKPHPAIVQHEHSFVVDKALFRNLMAQWREQVAADPRVVLVDDPGASIADSFAEADILVADRSSLLFEFMVLDRPILLYSSEARVGHWEYNPDAPGNAWRDIGMEFGDDQAFLALLADAANLHRSHCRDAQRARVQHLYGDYRDGRSAERVASAIAQVPRLHVVIDGQHREQAARLREAFDQRLAFKRISVIGSSDGSVSPAQWVEQRLVEPAADLAYLMVDAGLSCELGSAHQVSQGLAALASGECAAMSLSLAAAAAPEPPSTDSGVWIRQQLRAALERTQGLSALKLLPAHAVQRLLVQLPAVVDHEVFTTLWQVAGASEPVAPWQHDTLNVVLDSSVLPIVGGQAGQFLAGPNARLQLVSPIIEHAPSVNGLELLISAARGQQYDVYPFITQVWVNGRCVRDVTVGDAGALRLRLPYEPNERGITDVELRSSGCFAGMPGLAGPLSLYIAFAQATPVVAPERARIHQIFYSDETRAKLEPGYIPLDNVGQRPDWAEYWPMRNVLLNASLDENTFYGVLSPRFKDKTGLESRQVLEFVASAPDDADVLLFPVFYPDGARYENTFIQGVVHHPNIWPVFVEMARRLAPGVDLQTLVMDASQVQFCNYFIAKPRFWRRWFSLAETIFQSAEQWRTGEWPTAYGEALNTATLHRGTEGYECKVFVMERLVSLILATEPQWRVHLFEGLKPAQTGAQLNADLLRLDQLKTSLRQADTPQTRQAYAELRETVFGTLFAPQIAEITAKGGQVATAQEQIQAALAQFPALPVEPDMSQWLAERVPDAVQQRLISERLTRGRAPTIAVLVVNHQASSESLAVTAKSLSPAHNAYPAIELIELAEGPIPEQVEQIVRNGTFDWFMLVEAGCEFTASGLMIAALDLIDAEGVRAVYGDEMRRLPNAELQLAVRPDINLDMLLSLPGVLARHWLFNREAVLATGGLWMDSAEAFELDLILRLIEDKGLQGLGHINEPLLISAATPLVDSPEQRAAIERHLLARGFEGGTVSARLPGHYDLDYGVGESALVSILVSTEDGLERLRRCLDTLLEKTTYRRFEILLLDQGQDDPQLQAWLAGVEQLDATQVKVLRFCSDLSTVQVRNLAAEQAAGELLLWLHAGIAVLEDDWLQQLVNHACRQEAGAVGAKLLASDCTVRHGGLILGMHGPVGRVFKGRPMLAPGYQQRLLVDQNAVAVSGKCMMLGKALFHEFGGFDESPELACWADVDLCLRLHAAGYLNVWTPRAALLISETAEPAVTVEQEDALYARWLPLLARDPAYSPHLRLSGPEYSVVPSALSWQPLASWRPLPRVLACVEDVQEGDEQRIIQPLQALSREGLLDATLVQSRLSFAEIERFAPDCVIVRRPIEAEQIECLRRLSAFSHAFKVIDLDAQAWGQLSVDRQRFGHLLQGLNAAMAHADRLVVANPALAETFAEAHRDIRVVESRLSPAQWQGLRSRRGVGHKPRVGLVGGWLGTAEEALLTEVASMLKQEVEWVVLGACPPGLQADVQTVTPILGAVDYPRLLAGLDLDLALAPLAEGPISACAGNLRLLEFGACGVPVIASDVRAYQGPLHVTRVQNQPASWVEAIRMHLHDQAASAAMGEQLREQVLADWMLEGDHLLAWQRAWLA